MDARTVNLASGNVEIFSSGFERRCVGIVRLAGVDPLAVDFPNSAANIVDKEAAPALRRLSPPLSLECFRLDRPQFAGFLLHPLPLLMNVGDGSVPLHVQRIDVEG